MNQKFILSGTILFCFLTARTSFAGGPNKAKMLARLPPAVQQTIRAQLGGGKLNAVDKDAEDGDITYEVEIMRGGKTRDFIVGAGGELLEQQIFLEELSPAAQKAIQAQTGRGTLGDIYKSTDDGEISYDAEVTSGSQTREFTVADDGCLLSVEMPLAELPITVQKAIRQQAGGVAPDEIDQSFEDGETNYDVEITQAGQARDFTVDANGDLIEEQVFANELPLALQTAVQSASAGAKVGDIYKSLEDGEVSYDVDVAQGSQSRTLTLDAGGKVVSQARTIRLPDLPDLVETAVKSAAADGTISGISEVTEDQVISYDVELHVEGKLKSVSLSADGKILPADN